MNNNNSHSLGFVIKPNGECINFGTRPQQEIITEDFHYEYMQKIIKENFNERLQAFVHIKDIDTLSLLVATVEKSIVFLNITKYFGKMGRLYLPNELTEEQKEQMLSVEEELRTYNCSDGVANFDLVYNEQIKKNEMLPVRMYSGIQDFYTTLKGKKK